MRLLIALLFLSTNFALAQKVRVACIGNSVTAGYLLANAQKDAYPAQLQNLLGNTYDVSNFGVSGATLLKKGHKPYFKTTTFKGLIDYKADIAIIHLGLNDTDPRNWPNFKDDFQADFQWLIDTLKEDNPRLKIYICKLTPIFSGHARFKSGTRNWYWQIQEKIEQVAEANKLPLINLNKSLNQRPDLFADYLHPDAIGAGIIAKTVCEFVTGNFGGFSVDPIFSDHMVLQRDQPIPFYGRANAHTQVEIRFNGKISSAVADENGKWKIYFPSMKFGGPYQIEILSDTHKVQIKDVLIGDVWFCSGQSNMAFPLKSAATGKATLRNLNTTLPLRLLNYKQVAETDNSSWDQTTLNAVNSLQYFSGNWSKLDSVSASNFSAIAYYFGEKLTTNQKIPIGLVQMAVGGSTLESWIDRKTLEHDELLVDVLDNWRKSDFIQDWARGRADVNLKNATNQKQRHPYEPAYNFEAGVSKLTDFPIKGVIWYQGESNAHNIELFTHEMPILVKSWRNNWKSKLPFYYVQLSSLDRPTWPHFREAQRNLQALIPNSGMAVSSDLGDSLNVHPNRKKEIGERLALLALKNTYHQPISASGPVALHAVKKGNTVVITFGEVKQLKISNGSQLKGFEVADHKGNHHLVPAKIVEKEVYLVIPPQLIVTTVFYAWQPFTSANLVNEANLPASTFSILIK